MTTTYMINSRNDYSYFNKNVAKIVTSNNIVSVDPVDLKEKLQDYTGLVLIEKKKTKNVMIEHYHNNQGESISNYLPYEYVKVKLCDMVKGECVRTHFKYKGLQKGSYVKI